MRFHNLGVQSLWNDEGSSVVQASRSFVDIAANAARDIHPPGYYWLLAIWRAFTGESELALRSLSAFASVVTVAFTYALGRRLYGTLAGIIAALLVTLNTFSIYYAQEARMYALLGLWSAASLWALAGLLSSRRGFKTAGYPEKTKNPLKGLRTSALSALSSPQPRGFEPVVMRWQPGMILALALFNAAGLYTQYAFPFVMLAQGGIVLAWLIGKAFSVQHSVLSSGKSGLLTGNWQLVTGSFILANLLALLLFLPWLPTALAQVTGWPNTGDGSPIGVALAQITGWLVFGVTYNSANFSMAGYLFIFLSVAIVPLQSRQRPGLGWRMLFPILWCLLTLGLFLALGLFREANLKMLLPAQIAFALWMGRSADVMWAASSNYGPGFSALLRTVIVVGFGALLVNMASGLEALYTDPRFQRDDYRGIAALVSAELRPNDAIILDAPNQEEVFRYYYRGETPVYPLPRGLGGNDAAALAEVRDLIHRHDRIFALFWGEAERDPNRVVETTLDREAFEAGQDEWYGDVRLARYITADGLTVLIPSGVSFGETIVLEGYALGPTTVQPGDVLPIRLDWRTDQPLDSRYKVFVQMLNGEGVLVAQRDSEPGGGSLPTTGWLPGQAQIDRHGLLIPADLPSGSYQLIVGLYAAEDAQARLRVNGGDYLELATIRVR